MSDEKKKRRGLLVKVGAAAGAAVVGLVYLLVRKDGAPIEYTKKWFESLSDEALDSEREKVRLEYGNNPSYERGGQLQQLLWRFDEEMSRRQWGDQEPQPPSYHREHGWYLPNDD